jgi:hypothetical protein
MSKTPGRGPNEPLVVQLPERPPIVIDLPPERPKSRGVMAAPGLSGGRGMFKRLIVACDGMLVLCCLEGVDQLCGLWRFRRDLEGKTGI